MPTEYNIFFATTGNILLYAAWQLWWLYLLMAIVVPAGVFIFFQIRMSKVKDQQAELERQLLERSELLKYAKYDEQKARSEADHVKRSKSMLLSKINHEIRTPMNAVMGMASLLKDTSLTDEQATYTRTILNSSNSLLTVIKDMLLKDIIEYSKIESGTELESKDFDLRNCIEEVLDVFASKAAEAGLELVYNIDNNVPSQIIGDQLRLRQILLNLVDNAFSFTRQGEIFVGAHIDGNEEDGRMNLEFEVRDTGSGIPSDTLRRISRDLAKPAGENSYDYIGLSLVICKRLVDLMGGVIGVESTPETGSVFRFTIKTRISHQRLHPQNFQIAEIEGKEVLVVDDNLTVCNLLKNQLLSWRLKPIIALSGEKALDIVKRSSRLDLVITDMDMAPMDGIQLAQAIRELDPSLPIILMNRTGDESPLQHSPVFMSVLKKPIKQHMLSNLLFSGLKQKKKDESSHRVNLKRDFSVDFARQYPLDILLAEDDQFNQLMITSTLSKLGYKVDMVNDGSEVLETVSQNHYDLILMDVQMPKMDGLEATRMIRVCIEAQPVIIALTANSLQGDREECLRSGMDDYISKPVKLEELADMLEKWHYTIDKKKVRL